MQSALDYICRGSNMTPAQLNDYLDPFRPVGRREQFNRLRSVAEPLYWQAVRTRDLAQSYRGFRVGCAVYAFRADASRYEDRWRVFYGMNTKIHEDSRPMCAEPIAIAQAYAAKYTEIIGMVVVGEPQTDSYSGLLMPTLHPCHECRILMMGHPIVPRHLRIITALPPESSTEDRIVNEVQTLNQILRLHKEI